MFLILVVGKIVLSQDNLVIWRGVRDIQSGGNPGGKLSRGRYTVILGTNEIH